MRIEIGLARYRRTSTTAAPGLVPRSDAPQAATPEPTSASPRCPPLSKDVELRRETASIEREPINRPVRDGEAGNFGEEEVEVPLHEERPVASKETYATERVGIDKETETHREQVSDEVRRERADIDESDAGRR
jgi:uncharacterized protein (TIGR02271 family)